MKRPSTLPESAQKLARKSHPKAMRQIGRAELYATDAATTRKRAGRIALLVLALAGLYALVAFTMRSCGR